MAQTPLFVELSAVLVAMVEAFRNTANCESQLAGKTINLAGTPNPFLPAASIDFSSLSLGPGAAATIVSTGQPLNPQNRGLTVTSVQFRDVTPINPGIGHYTGFFVISLASPGPGVAIRPIRMPQQFTVDLTAGTPAARPINSCETPLVPGNLAGGFEA